MIGKTGTVIRHEFSLTVRRKVFIITTLSLPLLALIGMFVYNFVQDLDDESDSPNTKIVGYVDATGIFNEYSDPSGEVTFILFEDEAEAEAKLLSGQIAEYLIIPAEYLTNGQVVRFFRENELEPSGSLLRQIRYFLQSNLLEGNVSDELSERIKQPLWLISLQLDDAGEISEPREPIIVILVPYIFGLLFILSIFFTSGYLLQSVAEEKETRVIEILLSSITARQLLLGKIIGLGAAGLLQIIIWFTTIRIFADVASMNIGSLADLSIPTSMLVFGLIYFILGYTLFAIIFAGLGAIGRTAGESQQLSAMFTMPAAAPLVLLQLIGEHPDGIAARMLTFIPITAPTTTVMRLPNTDIPAWELGLSLAILLGSIAFGVWFVAKVFRVYLLMYGKRPGIMEIIRCVRES